MPASERMKNMKRQLGDIPRDHEVQDNQETQQTKSLFSVYCLLLVWIVLFDAALSVDALRVLFGNRAINLIPFHFQDDIAAQSSQVLMNILLFIPFGLYLKMMNLSAGKALAYGAAVSAVLECLQYALGVGVADITDLIANIMGTAVGVCCFELVLKIFGGKEKADRAVNVMTIVAMALWLVIKTMLLDAGKV